MRAGSSLVYRRYVCCVCFVEYIGNILVILILTIYQLAEADLASQARSTAGILGQGIQQGTTTASTAFQRLVEGDDGHQSGTRSAVEPEKKDFWDSFGAPPPGPSKDKQDFWDEFASAGESRTQAKTIGTAASKKPSGIGTSAVKRTKKEDGGGWEDW
jgi:ADP-ribosylation factor GTPase-activating protein 1